MNPPRWQHALEDALRGISPRRRWLIGVSGGRDSVALLHLLLERGYRKLIVCHLDHGLRGRASREDSQFVTRLAKSLGLPSITAQADVRGLAKLDGISLETAARGLRREFFRQAARSARAGGIFLAHQADDQVETFLFHLLRGAGPTGLAAMRPVSQQGRLSVYRPLLGVWRQELDAWLTAQSIPWREDDSNADTRHTRNRIRHRILPYLAKALGREVKPAIWRAAELLGAEEEWIDAMLSGDPQSSGPELETRLLLSEPVAKQRRQLRAWLEFLGMTAGFAEIEAVRSLLRPDAQGRPAKVNLPGNRRARRRAGRLSIAPPGA